MAQEKKQRNKRIKKLAKKNGGPLSYRELARLYQVDVKTIFDVVNRA